MRRWRIHGDNIVSLLHGITYFVQIISRVQSLIIFIKGITPCIIPPFLECDRNTEVYS